MLDYVRVINFLLIIISYYYYKYAESEMFTYFIEITFLWPQEVPSAAGRCFVSHLYPLE